MYVLPAYHGKGIGRALAEMLIQDARDIGYKIMKLDTGPRQLAALGLYRSLGFQEIEPYYDVPQEFGELAFFMELHL